MPTDTDKTAVVKDKENPYSLANMKKAYQALQTTARNVMPASDLKATHYYIKFLPANWEEYTVLVNFDTLNVYNYPLDKDIENPANYRDPSTPENMPMPQYASVPVGLNIDALGVRYEKLEDLFIPDDFEAPANSQSPELQALHSSPAKRDFIIQLVNTAMVQTGNDDDVIKPTTARAAYVPSGRVQVYDTKVNGYIPLEGVRVEARRWFTTHHGYTDANGNYRVNGDFKRECNYSLIFETGEFDVRSGNFGQARLNGPKQNTPWNINIAGGLHGHHSHVFRGAYEYLHKNNLGIGIPSYGSKIKIGAFDKDDDDKNGVAHPSTRTLGVFDVIKIYNPDRPSDEVFSTTVHELGHLAHWNQNRSAYNEAEAKVAESWARGVQWVFTNRVYRSLLPQEPNYQILRGWQHLNWRENDATFNAGYTPIVIDLIDNINQRIVNNDDANYPPDNVSGFTIADVWNALNGVRTMDEWRRNLILLNKANEEDINSLFVYYRRF